MEIRAFAEQVLLSGDLDAKLFAPERFTDADPGLALDIERPGRPGFLPLVSKRKIPPAPTPASIEDETSRGQALHTFAHHELLALELMALALLRWPDAPRGFRKGLAAIICDEQRHFRLYRVRAEHWGVGLGDFGVGHFFWDTVAPLRTPTAFLAALSLTYEQANIDFASYWKPAFAAVDDGESAAVLQEVYDDELRHVAHGVHWFRELAGGADFETWRRELAFPLTPGRAKGPVFNRQGRLDAGLDPAFVDELEIHNVSRGRPPRVFSFDPFVEERLAGRTPKAAVRFLADDLGNLPMFLAHREDVVVSRRPSLRVLKRLHDAGFDIPQFVVDPAELGDRAIASHCPWGHAEHPELYDKTWAFARRKELSPGAGGAVCHEMKDVQALVSAGGSWIAKAPFSSSGQHRVRFHSGSALKPDAPASAWLSRHLHRGPVVVEPWYERVVDLSIQVEVAEEKTKILGITRFWTGPNGAYKGALVGQWTRGLPRDVARFVHEPKPGAAAALETAALHVSERARQVGYRGPVGVDAMIVRQPQGLALIPLLEVNPRYTMGRIALALGKAGTGLWLFLPKAKMDGDFVQRAEAAGGLFTNDPDSAAGVVTLLVVGDTLRGAVATLETLGLSRPAFLEF